MTAPTILVAGTASHVGKSTVATGLCRVLATKGYDVAPFKAQNMSNNAQVVPRAGSSGPTVDEVDRWAGRGGEIGIAQYVQARAAGLVPTTDHNPVLLKPAGDGKSQVIVHGEAIDTVSAGAYYEEFWDRCRRAAEASYRRLADDHDVIVAEGAGSLAEPNLAHRDLANVETARFADAAVLLLADIERGGAFASLVGSVALAPGPVRDRLVGAAITKFRGDRSLLAEGLDVVESRTDLPVLGVLPYDDPGLPAEDSVSLPATDERARIGPGSNVPPERTVIIGVPRLPRAANTTDVEPLAREAGVVVEVHPLDAGLDRYDAIVIPGTKNTVDDCAALEAAGYPDRLRRFDGPVVGICGGYQLLGEDLINAHLEGATDEAIVEAVGLLPVRTRFDPEKVVRRVERTVRGGGPLGSASGRVRGYEIRHGRTEPVAGASIDRPFADEGAIVGTVLGTYLHGLFEHETVRREFLGTVFEHAGVEPPATEPAANADPYDRAAALVEDHLGVEPLLEAARAPPAGPS